MKLKRINLLLIITLFIGFACQTSKNTLTDTRVITNKVTYPLAEIPLPSLDYQYDFLLPEIYWEKAVYPQKDITFAFTSYDKENVRTKDPKLFRDGNTEIIDLAVLSTCDYAFPLAGAKVISPYAGRRVNHSGIDLKTHANDTIRAALDGVVRMAKPYAAYGNVIAIRHYNGLETVYSHNSKHLVKAGDNVKAGQPIALVGRTGRATTEHLHFEVRINGQHFNPELLFNFQTQELQTKSLLCIMEGSKIRVRTVDPFPYQQLARHSDDVTNPTNQPQKKNLN